MTRGGLKEAAGDQSSSSSSHTHTHTHTAYTHIWEIPDIYNHFHVWELVSDLSDEMFYAFAPEKATIFHSTRIKVVQRADLPLGRSRDKTDPKQCYMHCYHKAKDMSQ